MFGSGPECWDQHIWDISSWVCVCCVCQDQWECSDDPCAFCSSSAVEVVYSRFCFQTDEKCQQRLKKKNWLKDNFPERQITQSRSKNTRIWGRLCFMPRHESAESQNCLLLAAPPLTRTSPLGPKGGRRESLGGRGKGQLLPQHMSKNV